MPADGSPPSSDGAPPLVPPQGSLPAGFPLPARGQQPPIIVDDPFPPRLLNNVPPLYPRQARREGKQGTVLLRLEVMEHGAVSRVELLSSSGHEMLDLAAIEAVRGWRYAPVRQGGKPIRWAGRLPVNFVLD
ncbi:MAG: energy transducer TonB [Pirellulales bacterium]|nr:energy transducer TonB [Pirellulales bacterium]